MNTSKCFGPFLRVSFSLCTLLMASRSAFGSGTVTNLTQANLEAALAGGGTVLFAVNGTLPLTNTITISQSALIDANGYNVTISGGNSVRLFNVVTNVSFQINGLTLANGQRLGTNGLNGTRFAGDTTATSGESVLGGGIWNRGGMLTLLNCTLTNNQAIGGNSGTNGPYSNFSLPQPPTIYGGDAFGGCIYSVGGTVNMTNCTLAGNNAVGGRVAPNIYPDIYGAVTVPGDSGGAFGGALFLQGTGYFQNVTFLLNSATGGIVTAPFFVPPSSSMGRGGPALGGALSATNSAVFMWGCSAISNNAFGGSASDNPRVIGGKGSGAAMGGTLFFAQDCSANIQQLSAIGNSAAGGTGNKQQAGGHAMGGVIFNAGVLQVSDSTFSLNQSHGGENAVYGGSAWGGAIYSTNYLRINGCTFDHDKVIGADAVQESASSGAGGQGAGGALWSSGLLATTNSTFTANSAKAGGPKWNISPPGSPTDGSGGAVAITNGTAYLVNVTIAGNRADGGIYPAPLGRPPGPSQGGAIYVTNSTVTCQNSIFATSTNGGDVWGTLIDLGYNLCSDGTAQFSATGSLHNTDPVLGPLANNGGPTATMALLSGSPALNVIPSGYPPVDQRSVSRPQGSGADIGAFETASGLILSPLLVSARSGTNVIITFTAQGGLTYRLLHSLTMQSWSPVDTNSRATTGPLQFTQPTGSNPKEFYQVVAP